MYQIALSGVRPGSGEAPVEDESGMTTRSVNASDNGNNNRKTPHNISNNSSGNGANSAKIEFLNSMELTLRYPNRTERYLIADTERHRVSTIHLEVKPLDKNHKPIGKPKIIRSPREIIRTLKRCATDWEILWDDGGIGASYLPD